MAAEKTVDTNTDIHKQLQALKDDLLAVKEDVGKVTSSAVRQGREAAYAAKDQAADGLQQGVDTARQYVQERPLTSALVAMGVGMGLGLLLTRR
jgi:ElaB/YqjD/DUF883 family membrane-anchored ribosome-binding protein